MSLSYDCLIDLGQQVDNESEALAAEQALRPMFEWIRENGQPDALYSGLDTGSVIYDVGQLLEWTWSITREDLQPHVIMWRKALTILQMNKVYLIWVSF